MSPDIWLRHGRVWHHYTQPQCIIQATQLEQVRPALVAIQAAVEEEQLTAVGYLSYEASPAFDPALTTHAPQPHLPLLWFALYPATQRTSHDHLPPPVYLEGYQLGDWHASQAAPAYAQAIQQIKQAIARGETYQVNHTFRLTSDFVGDPYAFFYALHHAQNGAYAAYLHLGQHAICSASPELFFTLDGDHLTALPMKGTAPRGLTAVDDRAQAEWLANSAKNRAENVMIVDMIRNDLGRVARQGTVRVPQLCQTERYPTLWQMTSTVTADLPPKTTLDALFTALFPCASITGAPKVSTMRLIRQLEETPRGIYCGAIGFYAPHQQAQFNVAIRTVWLDLVQAQATYGVGSGVVWDSEAGDEYAECATKARVLTHRPPAFDLLETLRWEPATGYFLLERHLDRLAASADYFGWELDRELVRRQLVAQAATFEGLVPQRVRLLVTKQGRCLLTAVALPPDPIPLREAQGALAAAEPVELVTLAQHPIDSQNLFLYHKTTHRTPYEAAWHGRDPAQFADIILWNERQELTETTIANLALKLDGVWYTPPVHSGLLPGTYRAELLARGLLVERLLYKEDLARAENTAVFNSVRGWQLRKYVPT